MSKLKQILLPGFLVLLFLFVGISIGRIVNTSIENALSIPAACRYKKIAFIGGSITGGAGASEPANRYANKVGQWFRDTCGEDVQIKNISIGGTGSDYAVYRLEHDLDGFVPDLAFYEFAVNDKGQDEAYIRKHVEALIYKLRQINSRMIFFSVLVTDERDKEDYSKGVLPASADIHNRIASENDVPVINVGQDLWDSLKINDMEISDVLPDGVHPNDAGHQLYYESVVRFLKVYFEDNPPLTSVIHKKYSGDYANAALINSSDIHTTTCDQITEDNKAFMLCGKGDVFSFHFEGNTLGLAGSIQSDGGRLECDVDQSLIKTVDFWDSYAINSFRTGTFFLFGDLKKTQHELECTVLDQIISNQDGESQGNTVKIFHFMVNP